MGQAAFPGRGIRTGKGDARPDARPASLGPVGPGRLDAAGRGRSAGARVVGPVVEGEGFEEGREPEGGLGRGGLDSESDSFRARPRCEINLPPPPPFPLAARSQGGGA